MNHERVKTYLITTDQPKTTVRDELPPVTLPKRLSSTHIKKTKADAYALVTVDE